MIDGGIFIDKNPTNGRGEDIVSLIERLDKFNVQCALATSFKAIYFDDAEGNLLTAEISASSKGRLLPLAVINMLAYQAGSSRIKEIAEGPFYGVSLFPHLQEWEWGDYVVESFARDCAGIGLPIQACVWNRKEIADIARHLAPTGAKILLRFMSGGGYKLVPDILAAAKTFPNLVFDISTITQSGGIELLVEQVGANRLYVASSMPLIAEGAPYFLLEAANLEPKDRQMIQSGTLAKTLKIESLARPTQNEKLWRKMRDRPKVDTHWHTSGWNIVEPCTDIQSIRATYDSYNYKIAITSSIRALNHDIVAGNSETKSFTEIESRARGLIVVNPLEIETSISELEKYKNDPVFVGIKTIQDFYNKDLDDSAYLQIFSHLENMPGWTIMAHLPGMDRLAKQLQHVQFVAAHSTWRHRDFASLKNVWFDIATSTADRRDADLADLLAAVGDDRVLFSSDAQLINPAWTLGKLASTQMSDVALTKILEENAFAAFPRLTY